MPLLRPSPPSYDALAWLQLPLEERGRQCCQCWALNGYGTPPITYLFYLLKIALLVVGWSWFCSWSPGLGGLATLPAWWLEPVAFQKAIFWSMLFEGLGLGCGSGPLTGRYLPPFGGALYFLRPGTTKLPLWPRLPVLGGVRRSWLDVALYLALIGALLTALCAPAPSPAMALLIVALSVAMGIADRTVFLALRAEHYVVTIACFAFAGNWIAGAQAVQLALWFWAGVSKLNAHFPTVVCVMVSNSPLTPWRWLRRRLYRSFPEDLRPSRLATAMGHVGTALELGIPIALLSSLWLGGVGLTLAMVLMMLLHGFITSNVPMGVPLEWNVMVVYGGFALFWAHPEITVLQLGSAPLAAALIAVLVALPLAGNLWPHRISFLLAMRYYAGNWAYSVWLFRGDSHRKLDRLCTSAASPYDQLQRVYDRATIVGLIGKVLAFRLMHLHGRALPVLLPQAIAHLPDHEYFDGELIAGWVLGWNFGDGHLHHEPLLAAVQEQCQFAPGELRCVFVEPQALGGAALPYRIVDAATGQLAAGALDLAALRARQPWAAAAGPDGPSTL